MVQRIDLERFEAEVLKNPLPVLLEIYAPWCPRCAMLEDVVEQFAIEQKGRIKVFRMDEEKAERLMMRYGINRVPAFLAFRNGRLTGIAQGITEKKTLEELI
ncbi:MAG TPA: thioredoxin family protein [Candidatus Fusicatenibacter merdavium]|uniref:Thioredoxin family protein n=1 Tax=Candidatus Fusicatenibacter merdavium TaxID=2838600 RepID=A0A9D2BJ31_9FIRM|nr:thioredoxin family protein [Candidatus Fusicatenibacter merdavium]